MNLRQRQTDKTTGTTVPASGSGLRVSTTYASTCVACLAFLLACIRLTGPREL